MVKCVLVEPIQNIFKLEKNLSAPGQKVLDNWKNGKMNHGNLRRQCIWEGARHCGFIMPP